MKKNAKRMTDAARAPGRPKPGAVPPGDRPSYPTGEGLQ